MQADPQEGSPTEKEAAQIEVSEALAESQDVEPARVSVNEVGPTWGGEITAKARNALVLFFIAIAGYISLRFEPKMALAALAAVLHDILVTVGVYSLSGFEVTPATVIAFLTILGYSLYDTIVVFDKVQETAKGMSASGRMTYSDIVNLSMNEVLMRSLNTSLVAILPILSVLLIGAGVLGATSLRDFGLALLVGLLTGAYSSIYIASPILAALKEREPRYRTIRQRAASRGGTGILTPAAAAAALAGDEGDGGAGGGGRVAGGGRAKSGAKSRAGAGAGTAEADDDRLVPARDGATRSAPPRPRASGGARPHSGNRPGAPRPRKKGKKR